jgi:hypothetical protein
MSRAPFPARIRNQLVRGSQWFDDLATVVLAEKKYAGGLSLLGRVRAWRHGFLSEAEELYDFGRFGRTAFLRDYDAYVRGAHLNGFYESCLENKVLTYAVLSAFRDHIPELYAIVNRGVIQPVNGHGRIDVRWIESTVCAGERIVMKPVDGAYGRNIMILSSDDGSLRINARPMTTEQLDALVRGSDLIMITSFVKQAEYSRKIHAATTNTVRMIIAWDQHDNEPFVAAAMHRFGAAKSIPVDNISQGGLFASIALDTGELSKAKRPSPTGLMTMECHPDTGSPIEGVRIPRWESIKSKMLEIARTLPFIVYAGWDICVTDDGFRILEGNRMAGVGAHQFFEPLLSNERLLRFYRDRGVVDGV